MRKFLQDKSRTSKSQVWTVVQKGNAVITTWGQLDGAMQTTTQTFEAVNVGKSNEKSPEKVAEEAIERWVTKKSREGYREVDPKTNKWLTEASLSVINYAKLPLNLRFFKPQNSLNTYLTKKIADRTAILLRKRNGMMHVISIDKDGVPRMFGANMLPGHKNEPDIPWLARYPHIEQEVRKLKFPPNTILLGELCTCLEGGYQDEEGYAKDDFTYVESVVKSLNARALDLQKEMGKLGFCIWDVAFWNATCWLINIVAGTRFSFISEYLTKHKAAWLTFPEFIILSEGAFTVESQEGGETANFWFEDGIDLDGEIATLLNWAKKLGWEGFVPIDPDITYDDKAYNFHGKAERPKTCAKLKPKLEADFIVYWDPDNGIGEWGKGKKSKGVGSVMAYLWDPDTKVEVPVCKVGGGLDDELVHKFADPKLYPMVWAVEFGEWTEKGALRFPEFLRVRDDKTPEECDIYQRPVKEEEE
jgi:predicted DNA-binding WGR domain protein